MESSFRYELNEERKSEVIMKPLHHLLSRHLDEFFSSMCTLKVSALKNQLMDYLMP